LQAKDVIIAPAKGSEAATTTKGAIDKGFNIYLKDNFKSIN
jgi:hypothetical protein